jgi:hypothetical protein
LAESLEPLQRAFELGFGTRPLLPVSIASVYAELGERESALPWLEVALTSRLEDRPDLTENEALRAYRDDPEYRRLAGLLPNREFSRAEGWRYDLTFLVEEISRLHVNPDRPGSSAEFRAAVERLHDRIPELRDVRVFVEMQRLVAMLGDGHSVMYPFPTASLSFGLLPVDFYEFSDGLFIVKGYGAGEEFVGNRVVRFGPLGTEEVTRAVEPFITRDNPMSAKWTRPFYLAMPAFLHAVGATQTTSRCRPADFDRWPRWHTRAAARRHGISGTSTAITGWSR